MNDGTWLALAVAFYILGFGIALIQALTDRAKAKFDLAWARDRYSSERVRTAEGEVVAQSRAVLLAPFYPVRIFVFLVVLVKNALGKGV